MAAAADPALKSYIDASASSTWSTAGQRRASVAEVSRCSWLPRLYQHGLASACVKDSDDQREGGY